MFVLGALPGQVATAVGAVAAQGFCDLTARLRQLDDEMAIARAASRLPARPWVYGSAGLVATLAWWREVLADPPVAILVRCSPAMARHDLTRADRRPAAVALARWERSTRQMLESAAGLRAIVVPPSPTMAAEIDAFLRDLTNRCDEGGSHSRAARGSVPPAPPPPELSTSQIRLDAIFADLEGTHPRLSPPDLPPESPSTALLVEADLCFERQRDKLERCLATAVDAVEGLSRVEPPPPPPFVPAYGSDAAEDAEGYARWLERERQRDAQAWAPWDGPDLPAIGIVVVVDQPDAESLERGVASVVAQTHPGWQLCLGWVGEPADRTVTPLVDRLAATEPRARTAAPASGRVAAANAAAALVTAPFVAFVGQHDELHPSALRAVAEALAADPAIDVLYTDEDEIDQGGGRRSPVFKPDWSPDLLLSTMYIGNLLVVRRTLFERVGGLRAELEGSELYDLALRVTEQAAKVAHVARVAYHRRAEPPSRVPDAQGSDKRALESALRRRGERATVEAGLHPRTYRVRRAITSPPLVSIIVPFRDGADLLRQCVDSIHRSAGYDRWEIVLVDNQSWEPETTALLRRLADDPRCRLVHFPHPYNWSSLNNFGARHARGELLLLLNSDIEGIAPGWLAAMVEHAQRPEVGAVGARLLYPDGSVQHAGVIMGLIGSVAWHAFWKCPGDRPGYLGHAKVIRNYGVVTGACMLVRRDAFDAVGGLDETLAILFNDVELCLRMREKGYLVVYTPYAELFHYESKTRGVAVEQPEVELMYRRWGPEIARDPYFNDNLDRGRTEFALPR